MRTRMLIRNESLRVSSSACCHSSGILGGLVSQNAEVPVPLAQEAVGKEDKTVVFLDRTDCAQGCQSRNHIISG